MILFYHLVEFCNTLKYNVCYYITQDGFACLGTALCPKNCPKRDLCIPVGCEKWVNWQRIDVCSDQVERLQNDQA